MSNESEICTMILYSRSKNEERYFTYSLWVANVENDTRGEVDWPQILYLGASRWSGLGGEADWSQILREDEWDCHMQDSHVVVSIPMLEHQKERLDSGHTERKWLL